MRRLEPWSVAVAIAVLAAILAPFQHAEAQQTPATGETAPSAPLREILLQAALDELPQPPAFMRLVRITLQPGASVPLHSHPGPEFGRIESGTLTVRVEGEAVVAPAGAGAGAEASRVPPIGEEFDLGAGDQIVYPAGVPIAFRNQGREATTLLAVLVVPAGEGRPPASTWVGGTPGPEAEVGVTSQILGDAVTPGWPPSPVAIVLDRLALGPGESIPGRGGSVLLSVELGRFGFALVEGQFQVSRGNSGPQPNATPGTAYVLNPGDAVFFPGGMTDVPRPEDGVLVLLRLSVLPLTGAAGATPTAGTGEAPAAGGTPVRVTEAGVLLRATPSTGGEVVAEVGPERELIVTGPPVEGDGIVWYPVRAVDDPAVAGFVAEEFLAPPAN